MRGYRQYIAGAAIALPLSFAAVAGYSQETDIIDTAEANGAFTTLIKAVKAAGLEDTLKGDGPFTVFAPTDAAFAKLPEGKLAELLLPENKQDLVALLSYHVVAGKVTAADLAGKMSSLESLEGSELKVDSAGRAAKVNHAAIKQPDVMADNGVIHAIDKVITPE